MTMARNTSRLSGSDLDQRDDGDTMLVLWKPQPVRVSISKSQDNVKPESSTTASLGPVLVWMTSRSPWQSRKQDLHWFDHAGLYIASSQSADPSRGGET